MNLENNVSSYLNWKWYVKRNFFLYFLCQISKILSPVLKGCTVEDLCPMLQDVCALFITPPYFRKAAPTEEIALWCLHSNFYSLFCKPTKCTKGPCASPSLCWVQIVSAARTFTLQLTWEEKGPYSTKHLDKAQNELLS